MTQEEKDLLLKDLCARLPYKPIVHAKWSYTEPDGRIKYNEADRELRINDFYDIWYVKPYLRPMSSMTEEEKSEFYGTFDPTIEEPYYRAKASSFDCLNAHHLDYRGLIEKGLAIEVTKENNPYEK